jgi:molybdopterin-guanine dinucleotide biosynthesis protein A
MNATGVVVAGGRATRFGDHDKALAELDGRPLLTHVVSALGAVSDGIVVNCRPDQQAAFADAVAPLGTDVAWALDEQPDEGPLAGLATGVTAVDADCAVVLGCDMPLVEADELSALLSRLGDHDAVVPRTDGGPEPLHAVYRVGPTLRAARAALDDGERSLRALLDRLDVDYVDTVPVRSLTSVDTQDGLQEVGTDRRESE